MHRGRESELSRITNMESEKEVVIVGAGIAGLATALALKRIGIQSLVLERSDTLRATGSALTLFNNAWTALDALGVADNLTSIYTPFQKGYITDVTNGTTIEVNYSVNDRKMIGPTAVHRSILLETLAQELPADSIRFSSKLKSIETVTHEGLTTTILSLEDGTICRAKIVIGCDGVHSVVGRWLGHTAPMHSGRYGVRGLAVFPQGHGLKHEVQQFLDDGIRAGLAPINDQEVYWFSVYITDEDPARRSPEFIQKSVLEKLAHFPRTFLDMVQNSDLSTLTVAPLMFRFPPDLFLKNMYKGNIAVAGDAMHPMTPDLGQGGCASLEDAVILVKHIGNSYGTNGKIDSNALKGYVKERRFRVAMLITASYLSGWIQQGKSGWFKEFLRDKVFYKFFSVVTSNVVHYDCGKLPSVCTVPEVKFAKKTE